MSKRPSHIALHVAGPARGGIRGHLAVLARFLPQHGYVVHLAAPAPAWEGKGGWSRLALTERPVSALSPRVWFRLLKLLRGIRPAVVHAHGYKAATAALLAGGAAERAPHVVTFHNLWPKGASRIERAALRRIARRATLIAVSEAVAASIQRAAPGSEVVVIGNGVEVARFENVDVAHSRRALGLGAEEAVVGYFGRLTREKGPDLALAAVDRLRRAGVPVRLVLAGDGPERAALQAVAGPDCLFLGERADVPRLMAACDVILIPSRSEGQSVVALEAMAAERPIVATRVGGLAALAEAGGGLLVSPEDAVSLAAALGSLLADPVERTARAADGRDYVLRHGSAEVMVRAVAEVYDRVGRLEGL